MVDLTVMCRHGLNRQTGICVICATHELDADKLRYRAKRIPGTNPAQWIRIDTQSFTPTACVLEGRKTLVPLPSQGVSPQGKG